MIALGKPMLVGLGAYFRTTTVTAAAPILLHGLH